VAEGLPEMAEVVEGVRMVTIDDTPDQDGY
jgi:hypothetical protein